MRSVASPLRPLGAGRCVVRSARETVGTAHSTRSKRVSPAPARKGAAGVESLRCMRKREYYVLVRVPCDPAETFCFFCDTPSNNARKPLGQLRPRALENFFFVCLTRTNEPQKKCLSRHFLATGDADPSDNIFPPRPNPHF